MKSRYKPGFARQTRTRTIAGIKLTLLRGVRYYASRPGATSWRRLYPVTIKPLDNRDASTITINALSYERATKFINAFNNGPTSFEGRVW